MDFRRKARKIRQKADFIIQLLLRLFSFQWPHRHQLLILLQFLLFAHGHYELIQSQPQDERVLDIFWYRLQGH